MKRMVKLTLVLLALSLLMTVGVSAAGQVLYQGEAEGFLISPGSEQSPTDLFDGFKDVYPGDTLVDHIVIRNEASKDVKVKVYVRSLGAQEGSEELLSQMKLTVSPEGEAPLYAAAADQTGQLSDWVCLGTVYSGGEIPLEVTLEVPVTMGNEWQNAVGYLDWEFKVEEFPVEPSDPTLPETGDTNELYWYGGLMVISLLVVLLLLFWNRRNKEEKDTQ